MSSSVDPVVPMQSIQVEHADTQWCVAMRRVRGDDRPPLVLCNGIGVNWQTFEPLLAALGDRPVVAFDVPGVGASADPARPYTMSGLGRQVGSLLARLGILRFDLLGVSWGGALAQQLALQSTACRRLVLAATSTGWLSVPGRPDALMRLADARRLDARDRGSALRLADAYGGRVRREPSALHAFLQRTSPPSVRGYRAQLAAIAGWTSLPWLPWLRQPTLLLAGREDPLVPLANARLMQLLLRQAQVHVVDDGHLLLHSAAAEVAPRIAAFLDA
jgi:poly(3-hydroxyalkanoate) depolymerase